jgi:hypothetical protein
MQHYTLFVDTRVLQPKKRRTVMSSRRSFRFVAMFVPLAVMLLLATPTLAGGAMQISGTGVLDLFFVECSDVGPGRPGEGSDYAIILTEGDLTGCVYVFIEDAESSPSGTYRETGTEVYVIDDGDLGRTGTFQTNYRFTGKFVDPSDPFTEIFGRCQHPIVAGSGTDGFEDVTGRLDYKDDVDAGVAYYRGHLKW